MYSHNGIIIHSFLSKYLIKNLLIYILLISQRKEEPCPILAKNLYAMIHGAKWNERPTDIVLTGTLREEAKRTSSVGKLKNLVLSYENLGASHEREIYLSPPLM